MSTLIDVNAKPVNAKPISATSKPTPQKTEAQKPVTGKPTMQKPATLQKVAPKSTEKPAAKLGTKVKSNVNPKLNTLLNPTVKAIETKSVAIKPALTNARKDSNKKNVNSKNSEESKKDDKKNKVEKVKMERDSFTMPKDEYAQLALLKGRLTSLGQPAKKSELLRAGIKLLAAMSDQTLKLTLAKIPVIKTGRPNR